MNFLKEILWIPILLANIELVTSSWWNSSAHYLHARPPVKTVNNNGLRTTEGGHVGSWLLRIMDGDKFVCGASYYSALYALSSANCLHSQRSRLPSLSVEFLTPDLQQEDQEDSDARSFALIRKVVTSNEWRWPETFMDVAVVKLSHRLRGNLKDFVKLCTKPLSSYHVLSVVSCGAGLTEDVKTEGVTVLNRLDCESQYGSVILGETVACAKESKTMPGCMFSPGCPVTAGDELCGIVAWGPACKRRGMPGIFTDVHQVQGFISRAITGRGRVSGSGHRKVESNDVPAWHSGFWISR
ncbi:seminase [Drosophila biarmipes]|uniref:seminase n=1 Tax=Drosophila biarmipes TaxID=125945 RepID=UPI0007E7073A|nr:seminase [Drosophila biarmipes]